jgi:carboxypeptidase C (cathepsin A)
VTNGAGRTVARAMRWALFASAVLSVSAAALHAQSPQSGEEPIVSTRHSVAVNGRTLRYTARAGRIPIRDNDAGDVHGQMFFVSYALDHAAGAPPRPLTFVWNGGPGSNAALVHLIGFGPKRIAPPRGAKPGDGTRWIVEPNPGTWLDETDLVFVDPVGTGYSRPTRPEYAGEFYQNRGDAESVAEFIRVYRTRYDAFDAPLFLAGESFGVTRAAGVADALERRGTEVRGVILLGLELPLGRPSNLRRVALGLPNQTIAAFANGRLAPDLQRDMSATMKEVESWAATDYLRALTRRDSLTPPERDSVVRALSRFTGLDAAMIDRGTLTVDDMQLATRLLREEGKFVGLYDSRMVGALDTTDAPYDPTKDPSLLNLLDDVAVLRYLRDELGYRNDLRYQGPFGGGYPPAKTFRGDWMSVRWSRPAADTLAPQPLANAMRVNPSLRVLIGCGIYDLVCDYAGNAWTASHLDAPLARNVVARSYPGGHAMYTDPRAHLELRGDVVKFIRETLASSPSVR